jgi:hypothetical protein
MSTLADKGDRGIYANDQEQAQLFGCGDIGSSFMRDADTVESPDRDFDYDRTAGSAGLRATTVSR